MANCKADDTIYEADGTIHVRYGSCGQVKSATFIPSQYVEQGGRKFVVFVPRDESESCGIVVRADESNANGAKLCCADKFDAPLLHAALLHAALRRTKVTVSVSNSKKKFFALKGITIPAILKKPSTA